MECINCGKDFKPTGTAQKFCSVECREEHYQRQKQEISERLLKGVCHHCRKPYTKTTGNQRYCSEECREIVRKQTYVNYNRRISLGLKPYDINLLGGIQGLANAIVKQACDDYRRALRGLPALGSFKSAEYTIMECERFFRSEWYCQLTDLDSEWLIKELRKEIDTFKGL